MTPQIFIGKETLFEAKEGFLEKMLRIKIYCLPVMVSVDSIPVYGWQHSAFDIFHVTPDRHKLCVLV